MADVVLLIPWRSEPSRERALALSSEFWLEHFPRVTRGLGDSLAEPFSLSETRNQLVEAMAGEHPPGTVFILADADTVGEPAAIREAVNLASTDGKIHLPYRVYRSLGSAGTWEHESGLPLGQCSHLVINGATSGIYIGTADAWRMTGGQDPRFRGWGFEDCAWAAAYRCLAGEPPRRHHGRLYAFHHDPAIKAEGPHWRQNMELMQRYYDAERHGRDSMLSLIGERGDISIESVGHADRERGAVG